MRLGPYRLHAPLWAVVVTVLVMALFARLGVWQLDRAAEKKAIITAREQAAKAHPVSLNSWLETHDGTGALYRKGVSVRGRPLSGRQLLLDNQMARGVAGYHIWTPVKLEGKEDVIVLVDRGWVPMNPDRSIRPNPPMPDAVVTLHGMFRDLPRPGIRLGEQSCKPDGHWPRIVDYPRLKDIDCLYHARLLNGVVLLDASEPNGFRREWNTLPIKPLRHYSYAVQWFAMALAVMVVFFVVNSKRERRDDDSDEG